MSDSDRTKSRVLEEPALRGSGKQRATLPRWYQSPSFLLTAIATSIFIVEGAIMLAFHLLPPISSMERGLIDASVLTLLLFPILYLLLFRPLILHINNRKRAEETLQESEERYRDLYEEAPNGYFSVGADGRIHRANRGTVELLGYTVDELVGRPVFDLYADTPTGKAKAQKVFRRFRAGEEIRGEELEMRRADGRHVWINLSVRPIRDAEGQVVESRSIVVDITERKRAEETIRHLAYHDALTDLPNRALFKDRLTMALAQARRNKQMLAVMFLDLDRFEIVNDTVGHAEGDQLLRSVGEQLIRLVREGDTVARLGGDEFILLLPGITQLKDAVEVAQRILESFEQPRVLAGHEFRVTASIGITIYPTDGGDAEILLRTADTAMYRAKELGRDNYQLYTPGMNARILERLALESSLRHALERGEFVVYYQPQADINTGQIVGVEALVRWQHPDRGLVLPGEFIPVAEDTGLIVPLGEWVLRTACAQFKAWQEAGLPPLRVAVNLSARQFQQPDLVEMIARVLKETRLDPHCLELEITEGIAAHNTDFTTVVLRDMREMGMRISIDDFGTGHSSLSYLTKFPIDTLKIDRSFVRDLTTDPNDAAIATAVIAMARSLNLKVIAEGVETEEQLAFLRQHQCDAFQGYLLAKPMPAEALEKVLRPGAGLQVSPSVLKSA